MVFDVPALSMVTLFLLLGLSFGSFGSVILTRVPEGKSLRGWSRCPGCKKRLKALDLIPLLSFLFLMGKCRYCRRPISPLYPLLELVSGTLFVFSLFVAPSILSAALLAGCVWLLLLIALFDYGTQQIPDVLSIPFIVLALAWALITNSLDPIAIALGLLLLGGQWILSRGRWIGSGDLFLVVGIALLLGPWRSLLIALALSYILGAIAAAVLLTVGAKKRTDAIAFAPFLALGTFITLVYVVLSREL